MVYITIKNHNILCFLALFPEAFFYLNVVVIKYIGFLGYVAA